MQNKKMLKELKRHLQENGKDNTWVNLYNQYPFKGTNLTNKQKSDAARGVYRKIKIPVAASFSLEEYQDKYDNYIPEYSIPNKEDGLYLILGCVHAPFVNMTLWKALLKFASDNKNEISGLILNGDFLDMNTLSFHDRGKMPLEGINLGWEYDKSKQLLLSLEKRLNSDIYKGYLRGNHEERYERQMKDPSMYKLKGSIKSPEDALGLTERNWDIYLNWKEDEIELGDISIIHGEFFNEHVCKKYLDVFKKNLLFAHTHRQQLYTTKNHKAYNIGCMLDINAQVFNYASKAMRESWVNGFAVGTLYNNRTSIDLVRWEDSFFSFGGKIYQ
jgi:hypothetical protein